MNNDNHASTVEAMRAFGESATAAREAATARMASLGRAFNEAAEAARESRS